MDESQISAYLELFDLPDSFTEAQLKQAYRDLVQVWHPDKHSHNERLRKKADEKMKEINKAYGILESGLINGRFHFVRSSSPPGSQTSSREPPADHRPPPENEPPSTESPPWPRPFAAIARALPKELSGNTFWILTIAIILLVIIAGPRGRKVASTFAPQAPVLTSEADLLMQFSIQGPPAGSNIVRLPVSRELDEKNGFKELKFGLTTEEARKRLKPDRTTTNEFIKLVTFWYGAGLSNKLGDFPLDYVTAFFFREKLFKIEVSFSSNQEQVYETLQRSFGASRQSDLLMRGSQPLRAECWTGERVFCAIVAPMNSNGRTGWDALVMYDTALNLEAQQYAREEPMRAAQALSEDGFGEFKFGMTVKEFSRKLRHPAKVSAAGIGREDAVTSATEEIKLGRYPIASLRASFFQKRLFRLDLGFEANQQEIYQGFMSRFPEASDNGSWTRDGDGLSARQFLGQRALAVILAPRSGSPQWDVITLYDLKLEQAQREFERDAPKRAAKDL
jgi:curved DNA-binding protein CbpA